MNVEWIATLERCIKENGGKIEDGKITMKGEFLFLPLAVQNALVELVEEWGYTVIFE